MIKLKSINLIYLTKTDYKDYNFYCQSNLTAVNKKHCTKTLRNYLNKNIHIAFEIINITYSTWYELSEFFLFRIHVNNNDQENRDIFLQVLFVVKVGSWNSS